MSTPGSAADRSRIADPGLAAEGRERIEWVARHSPVLHELSRTVLADGALRGRRIAIAVHLEAKTAHLALVLAHAGAEVVAASSNPASTQDPVCAALVDAGIEVHAVHGSTPEAFDADLLAVADTGPELVIDDGAELATRLLEHRPALARRLRGVSEETTTGVARLRALAARAPLPFPAVAVNDAACKYRFDNRYGTGQTTVQAALALTNSTFWGADVVVVGYGWVGRGLVAGVRALGGRVTVVETDPVTALEAHFDGCRVAPLPDALSSADFVLTATGGTDAVPAAAIEHLRDGTVLANAGHDAREIDTAALRAAAVDVHEPRPGIERLRLGDGRTVHLLVGAELVNIAGGDGHPIEIMDLSFSVQALAAHHLATHDLPAGLHRFPTELDALVARTKLATLGIDHEAPDA